MKMINDEMFKYFRESLKPKGLQTYHCKSDYTIEYFIDRRKDTCTT